MKNYEKYADEIRECKGSSGYFCNKFIMPHILKKDSCAGISCEHCHALQMIWLLEDYEEPETDWSKVEIDTPILVRDSENTEWLKKYFAKYENGQVYVWNLGRTSWTAPNDKSVSAWSYAKLAESEESEVDWNEVKIDTPIMVRDSENGDWFKRYFAEYKNGKIYTWDNGHTSWETSRMIEWKYAKLVEDEE